MKCIQHLPDGKTCGRKTDGGFYCKYHKNPGTRSGTTVHHHRTTVSRVLMHRITKRNN